MNSISSLMEQLNSFESPEAIAEFLRTKDIKGDTDDSESCIISNWILAEANVNGCSTDSDGIKVYVDDDYSIHEITDIVVAFIRQFDNWDYPDLVFQYDEHGELVE